MERIKAELIDVMAVMWMLEDEGFDVIPTEDPMEEKRKKVEKYIEYAKSLGTIKD